MGVLQRAGCSRRSGSLILNHQAERHIHPHRPAHPARGTQATSHWATRTVDQCKRTQTTKSMFVQRDQITTTYMEYRLGHQDMQTRRSLRPATTKAASTRNQMGREQPEIPTAGTPPNRPHTSLAGGPIESTVLTDGAT